MSSARTIPLAVALLGVVAAVVFHSSGALDARDALTAASLRHGVGVSPPMPVTSRVLSLGVDSLRLVQSHGGLFRCIHLTGGILLALAAAAMARVATRLAPNVPGAVPTAAVLVGTAMLFGGDLAGRSLGGGSFAVIVALLSFAALLWTQERPARVAGGFLLGLALAEEPLVLLVVPGLVALAPGVLPRALLGLVPGFAAVLLPILDSAGTPLLDVGDPSTPARALGAWWGGPGGPFWAIGGPGRWLSGFVEVVLVAWRNLGPIGLIAAIAADVALLRRRAPLGPTLLATVPMAAVILGQPRDVPQAAALLAWSFLPYTVLGVTAFTRVPSRWMPAAGLAAGAALLAINVSTIDGSAERGVTWARDSFGPLPPDALLLTANPVHLALAADGERADVAVVYVNERSTWNAWRPGLPVHVPSLPPGESVTGSFLGEIVGLNRAARPVLLDPTLFFTLPERGTALGDRWRVWPDGLAYLAAPHDDSGFTTPAQYVPALAKWEAFDLQPGTPPSPLRDGLTGEAFYTRGLLQGGSLLRAYQVPLAAEQMFLFALTLDDVNRTLAAYQLAGIFMDATNYEEGIATLTAYTSIEDNGAWLAYRLLSALYQRVQRRQESIEALQRAVRLIPPDRPEKEHLESTLRRMQENARR